MTNQRKLLEFHMDCGRAGDLGGLFIVDDKGWDTIQKIIREEIEISYGEVLGKHSDVSGVLTADEITILSVDQEFIDDFLIYVGKGYGYNPLDCYVEGVPDVE